MTRLCTIEGCGKRHYGHGLCQRHLYWQQHHGDPLLGDRVECPWNPWSGKVPCPRCGSSEFTLPYAPGDSPSWRCIAVGCSFFFIPEFAESPKEGANR